MALAFAGIGALLWADTNHGPRGLHGAEVAPVPQGEHEVIIDARSCGYQARCLCNGARGPLHRDLRGERSRDVTCIKKRRRRSR